MSNTTIEVSIEEYTRLKDIETRFAILKEKMLKASYCPIHHQIILGIEKEYEQNKAAREFMDKNIMIPSIPPLPKGGNVPGKGCKEAKKDLQIPEFMQK